jgi:hypothetical protein
MIGVISKADQVAVVEEFFELFKTPWQFYKQGQRYDVVVATVNDMPEVDTRLLLVYGSETKSTDLLNGITVRSRHKGGSLDHEGTALPIYADLATFKEGGRGIPCLGVATGMAGVRVVSATGPTVIRLGYDLFDEVRYLLSVGQPVEQAHIPTLEIHIRMLRDWILNAGILLVEIPPAPAHHSFIVCLTHDIDFVGIREHRFDHTMWGFLYRATLGALRNFVRGRLPLTRLLRSWLAAASLPFVYAGWVRDFWEPFEWYLGVEKGLPATYFLIPFKRRPGSNVPGRHASRRATAYDVSDLHVWAAVLQKEGCELGVHGIDAWHSVDKGRDELAEIAAVTGKSGTGIRVHWLLRDATTPCVLERAGYHYDSTFGYNETVGYRAGTSQVFRPLGVQTLLELPLHIQDGALFYPQRLDLSEPEAEKCCQALIDNANKFSGVLTLLWHDRSHGPERFWGEFYVRLLQTLRALDGWFGTASQVTSWFRKRRRVCFEPVEAPGAARTCLRYDGEEIQPPLKIRLYGPPYRRNDGQTPSEAAAEFIDIPWNGKSVDELDLEMAARFSTTFPNLSLSSLSLYLGGFLEKEEGINEKKDQSTSVDSRIITSGLAN